MFFNPFSSLIHWVADKLAGRSADAIVGFLNSEPGKHSGALPDFRFARSFMRDGDLEEAASYTKGELEKDPENYEGLMLLASIYAQMGKHALAICTLDTLLKSSIITEGQVAVAKQTREGYAALMNSLSS